MSDGESTGSNAIWAVALVIIVAIIVGAVIYGGKFFTSEKKVDINVTAPSTGGSH